MARRLLENDSIKVKFKAIGLEQLSVDGGGALAGHGSAIWSGLEKTCPSCA